MKKKAEYSIENFKKELNEPKKKVEMNLDLEYWKKKFLYPYALDTAPIKLDMQSTGTDWEMQQQNKMLEKLGKTNFNVLESTALQFPLSQIHNKEEYLIEL